MNGLERSLGFISGKAVDHPPFLPIVMRWAARYAGVPYRDFCLIPQAKAMAMAKVAEDFAIDWLTVMSDPYCEAEAFGLQVEYPADNLPIEKGGHLSEAEAAFDLKPYDWREHKRCCNRVEEIKAMVELSRGQHLIVGWVEGPMAEYADIRGVSEAAMDLIEEPEAVRHAMGVIVESALPFALAQVEAGAHCIGIGDAFASQIGPKLYREFVFDLEKQLVEAIHAAGGLTKIHICGNISSLLPDLIKTGSDIIDIDHLVPDLSPFAPLLAEGQVFSGKADPVSIIQDGTPEQIEASVRAIHGETNGRCIVSAGCEVPPDTSVANMLAFSRAARSL